MNYKEKGKKIEYDTFDNPLLTWDGRACIGLNQGGGQGDVGQKQIRIRDLGD